jgi:hypothetical protein
MVTIRRVALAILVVAFIVFAVLQSNRRVAHQNGISSARSAVPEEHAAFFDRDRSTIPFLYIYMYPKYPGPGEEVIGGLKVAVWQDGKVVRTRSAAEVGKAYIEGRLRPEQLNQLVRLIERTGILATPPDDTSPMHQASDFLKIRTRSGLLIWSHTVPNAENALVKQIEDSLMAIDIPDIDVFADTSKWVRYYPHEWEK